jgi:ABC-type thiamine transport system ATPase subunit
VSDAIDPAFCPAATLEPSVRAEAHEVVISRRAEAAVTVVLVTTSKNRLNLEGQRFVLRGTLTAVYKCKKKAILASLSHLMRLDSLFSYMDDSNSKQLQINLTAVYMH